MRTSLRIKLVLIGFLSLWGLILLRLFYWQVVVADRFAAVAARQRLDLFKEKAQRGKILSSDSFPLVANEEVFLLFANPREVEAPAKLAYRLAPILVSDKTSQTKNPQVLAKEAKIKEQLVRSSSAWIPLERKVARKVKEKIESLGLQGLGFEKDSKRIYPEGTASGHLLGFLGSDEQGQNKGYFGLEGFYDLELKGRPGLIKREKDATGKPILLGESSKTEKRDGRSLKTTLDRTAQFIISRRLKEALKRYGAVSGSAVLMDPSDGAILAMVSLPTYDPEIYSQFKQESFPNPVIASSYEPGSVFKILVMAAAINEAKVTPETRCPNCHGPRLISGFTISTWDDKYYPQSTMTEVLTHSDNVGMIYAGQELGAEAFFKYLTRFGFGEISGIDLQEESSPPLRPLKDWKEIDLATASFGQGIAVTPLQMIRAAASIANGGRLVRPYVVKAIIDQGQLKEIKPSSGKKVLKNSTVKTVTEMMVEAVEKGEAKWAKPKGFKVAGKTGTAQIPVAGHYDEEKTIASFIGFAPAEKPRFIMLVTLREPTSSPWGSETAAPLWFEIAKELFLYFGISPE
jgi:cell division protein FtsI/penicillin-binding protein 2